MAIEKVLIANRGEIASRIIRTCRAMGIDTVAVYSEADVEAPFVREASEAVPLGGRRPADSYLRSDLALEAARLTGADAVHPGYGFLSENSGFARSCRDAGLTFIGPSPEVIELMASKTQARALMEEAGVPIVPGWHPPNGQVRPPDDVLERLQFPLLVKAAFGGGGRGMRVVDAPAELDQALAGAEREAASSFGDGAIFLERYIRAGRHIEVQILGDSFGTVVHLFERDCSLQRRHQKVIEEAPAPNLDSGVRDRLHAAAVAAGRALGYEGAGTVEFIVEPSGEFHFLEVNTRLQVEHPVTEMVLGLDLVRLQILVADRQPLPDDLRRLTPTGHAIEARLYAEDPANGYAPSPGLVRRFEVGGGDGVRVDSGVQAGSEVTADYDPMLAKVICHGATRDEAIRRMRSTLRNARIHGVRTNAALLQALLASKTFQAGESDTAFLDRADVAELISTVAPKREQLDAALVVAVLVRQARQRQATSVLPTIPPGWRNNPSGPHRETFLFNDREHLVERSPGSAPTFRVDGAEVDVTPIAVSTEEAVVLDRGVRRRFGLSETDEGVIFIESAHGSFEVTAKPRYDEVVDDLPSGSLTAQIPGVVVRVAVSKGDRVERGDVIVVMEAMKTEYTVAAREPGLVTEVLVAVGDTVSDGALVAVVEAVQPDVELPVLRR